MVLVLAFRFLFASSQCVKQSSHREIPRDFPDSKTVNAKKKKKTKQNRGVKLTYVNIRRAQRNKP